MQRVQAPDQPGADVVGRSVGPADFAGVTGIDAGSTTVAVSVTGIDAGGKDSEPRP